MSQVAQVSVWPHRNHLKAKQEKLIVLSLVSVRALEDDVHEVLFFHEELCVVHQQICVSVHEGDHWVEQGALDVVRTDDVVMTCRRDNIKVGQTYAMCVNFNHSLHA